MRSDKLMDAMGMIDDETILDARNPVKKRRRIASRIAVAAVAAAALCLTLAVPALTAANVPSAYQLLYAISPGAAQTLKPVNLSCEDNGIRMEVLSACVYEDTVDIEVSLRDLTGNRVDETTDLFDSYSINRPFSSSATCSLESYDDGVAVFLIHLTQWDNEPVGGEKITFSFSKFLSGKQEHEGALTGLSLDAASMNPATQTGVSLRGFGGILGDGSGADGAGDTFLTPADTPLYRPVDGVTVTALGYINGELHVQTYYESILETDNHGGVYLVDADGDRLDSVYSVSFWDPDRRGSYLEQAFRLSPEQAKGYQIHGQFTTCGVLTTGDWQVTFPLEKVE